jgi:hypothetical protein
MLASTYIFVFFGGGDYLTTFSVSRPVPDDNDELERIWKEAIVAKSRQCPDICLEELS